MKAATPLVLAAAVFLPLILPQSGNAFACGFVYTEKQAAKDLPGLPQQVELLWSGTAEERRHVFQEGSRHFRPLQFAFEGENGERAREVADSLHRLLWVEQDDWVLDRLLAQLVHSDAVHVLPIFRDALEHSSPAVRWRAIQFFVRERDPEARRLLEETWDRKQHDWVRLDLASALACQGSEVHLPEMLERARSENSLWSEVAIEGLAVMRSEEALPVLLRLSAEEPERRRAQALRALSAWPPSPESRELFLQASVSNRQSLRIASTHGLPSYEDDAVVERLVELALDESDSLVQSNGLSALTRLPAPAATPALQELIERWPSGTDPWLREWAAGALKELRSKGAAAEAARLDPFRAGRLPEGVCPLHPRNRDPERPLMLEVSPPPGLDSIRCWDSPGRSGDPRRHPRISAGTRIRSFDLFEAPDGVWQLVWSQSAPCWVRAENLVEPPGDDEPPLQAERPSGPRRRFEFDLPAAELGGEAAGALQASELLRVVDPESEVVGVAVEFDPGDPEQAGRLAGSFGYRDTVLDRWIAALAEPLLICHPEQEAIADVVAFAERQGWEYFYGYEELNEFEQEIRKGAWCSRQPPAPPPHAEDP